MNYQPDLYIFNIESAGSKQVYDTIRSLGFGRIRYVELEKNGCAFVSMEYWDKQNTRATRIKLHQGKPLRILSCQNETWTVYSYENRKNELEAGRKRAIMERQKKDLLFRKQKLLFLEQRKREQEEQERQHFYSTDDVEWDDYVPPVVPVLDYGNVYVPQIREKSKQLIKRMNNKK